MPTPSSERPGKSPEAHLLIDPSLLALAIAGLPVGAREALASALVKTYSCLGLLLPAPNTGSTARLDLEPIRARAVSSPPPGVRLRVVR